MESAATASERIGTLTERLAATTRRLVALDTERRAAIAELAQLGEQIGAWERSCTDAALAEAALPSSWERLVR